MHSLEQRYAQSLLTLAHKQALVGETLADLTALEDAMAKEVALETFFASPLVKRQAKSAVLNNALQGRVQKLTLDFLGLVIRNGRAANLKGIVAQFRLLIEKEKGLLRGVIVSAQPLEDAQFAAIDRSLSERYKATFQWTTEVDPSLVAGFRVRIGDQVIDQSLALKLKELEKQLMAKA
jgi:F-type H+-transporting ATPase subunit delta